MSNNWNLAHAPDAVFRVWKNRLRIEVDAAKLFFDTGRNLISVYGPDDPIANLCLEAGQDELRHADRCEAILNATQKVFTRPQPIEVNLGPSLAARKKNLYACVSMGCVTETLSTALLIEMHKRAQNQIVQETIHEILVDEVNHSRIGWAELARSSEVEDSSWLSNHIPHMISDALATDVKPLQAVEEEDLSAWGILQGKDARKIMTQTIEEVIRPGLQNYGINF